MSTDPPASAEPSAAALPVPAQTTRLAFRRGAYLRGAGDDPLLRVVAGGVQHPVAQLIGRADG